MCNYIVKICRNAVFFNLLGGSLVFPVSLNTFNRGIEYRLKIILMYFSDGSGPWQCAISLKKEKSFFSCCT